MINFLFFSSLFPLCLYLTVTRSAAFLFVLYQFIYFMNPQSKWWRYLIPELSYSYYVVLLILVVTVVNWRKSNGKLFSAPNLKWLVGIGLCYLIASLYAIYPILHTVATDAIVTAIVVVLLVYKLCNSEQFLKTIVKGYIFSATYMGYYITQFGRTLNGRYSGGGMVDAPDENGIAAALAPALILAGYYIWQAPGKWKLAYLLCAGFLANGLVQIGSRGSFLGVACGAGLFFVFLYFSKAQIPSQKAKVMGMLLVGLASVPMVTDNLFWQRFLSIQQDTTEITEKETGATRIHFWKAAIQMSTEHPLGAGASAFVYYSPFYIDENINTGGTRNRAVHSTWFEALTEIGYPGFLCLIMLIYSSFKSLQAAAKHCYEGNNIDGAQLVVALGCALVTFVVAMTFLNRIRAEILYWLILFIACSYKVYVENLREIK